MKSICKAPSNKNRAGIAAMDGPMRHEPRMRLESMSRANNLDASKSRAMRQARRAARQIAAALARNGAIAIVLVASLGGCAPPTAPPPLAQSIVSPREKARQELGLSARDTRIEFKTQPQPIAAGKPALWSLKVLETRRKEDGKSDYVRSFESDHNRLMHLIVVSRDLSFWKHLAPDYKDYGHFLIETTLPTAGQYQLFADYTPYKGREQVARQQLIVAPSAPDKGAPQATVHFPLRADTIKNGRITKRIVPATKTTSSQTTSNQTASSEVASSEVASNGTISSYATSGQVTLVLPGDFSGKATPSAKATRGAETGQSGVVAGRETMLRFQLRDGDGSALADSDLDENSCFIVSSDGEIYLHPPGVEQQSVKQNAADSAFAVRFPAPGIYKVWFEFYLRDEVLVAPFVLNVAP